MPTTVLPIAAIAGDIADLADFANSRPHLPERMVTERRRYRAISPNSCRKQRRATRRSSSSATHQTPTGPRGIRERARTVLVPWQ